LWKQLRSSQGHARDDDDKDAVILLAGISSVRIVLVMVLV